MKCVYIGERPLVVVLFPFGKEAALIESDFLSLLFHTHRDLDFALPSRTLPRKLERPVATHLWLEFSSINAQGRRFRHFTSRIHNHAGHIHGETSLHFAYLFGLTL